MHCWKGPWSATPRKIMCGMGLKLADVRKTRTAEEKKNVAVTGKSKAQASKPSSPKRAKAKASPKKEKTSASKAQAKSSTKSKTRARTKRAPQGRN